MPQKLTMEKHTILIADGLAKSGKERLKSPGVELLDLPGIERDELKKKLRDVNILIVRSRTKVDADLLEYGKKLKLIIRAGIGLDNIDVASATDHGVVVMNAPTGNIVTTAEHALALMFAVSRHVTEADASLRKGKWEKKKFRGNEIRGKTLGIVGLGNIGKSVAQRALALGMKVLGHDPYVSPEAAAKQHITLVSFDELLKSSDYVSLHLPLTGKTKHLINASAFEKMKTGAYLIQCARGGIVDEKALIAALESGKLAGCALDVYEQEPVTPDNPILQTERTVLTPHLGASTDEAQEQVSLEVAEQVHQYLNNGVLRNAVNVPNVDLEQLAILKPYLSLCERLGGFVAQVGPKSVRRIRVRYRGTISDQRLEVLTLSVLKGFLTPLLSATVNFVNARNLLRERGIGVEESFESDCEDFASLIEVEIEGENDDHIICSGTLFGKQEPRIVRVDKFDIDAVPQGSLLFTKNMDEPGVIGSMGTILGGEGINIARMALGFDRQKGQAIALINIDSAPSQAVLEKLRQARGMVSVIPVEL